MRTGRATRGVSGGFTLIELLIVVSIIGILVTIAQPSWLFATRKAREAVLRENLFAVRESIDQYHADRSLYPWTLADLVERGYLRRIPEDPVTRRSDTWVTVPPPEGEGKVYDIRSGAAGAGLDNVPYSEW